jgi:hypothetical protein
MRIVICIADSHNILSRWKNYFSQLLNVHNVSDVRHTAEPLIPEIAIAKLKNYKSPGSDQIPVERIQAGDETLLSVIHKSINCIWNKEELPDQWKEPVIVPVHKKGDKTDCNNYRGMLLLSISYTILSNIVFSGLSPHLDESIRDHQCGFRRNRSATDKIFCIR